MKISDYPITRLLGIYISVVTFLNAVTGVMMKMIWKK